jgi:hypothetical protein
MLAGGAAAVAALVALGYPYGAVGVPGAARSNLDPPSLAAVALAVAQVGAAVLALPWLRHHANRARTGPQPARHRGLPVAPADAHRGHHRRGVAVRRPAGARAC